MIFWLIISYLLLTVIDASHVFLMIFCHMLKTVDPSKTDPLDDGLTMSDHSDDVGNVDNLYVPMISLGQQLLAVDNMFLELQNILYPYVVLVRTEKVERFEP